MQSAANPKKPGTVTASAGLNSAALSRRQAIALGASGLLLAGCSRETPTPAPAPVNKVNTIASLFSQDLFFVAHRGSGDNWPEHTMQAYSQSAARGVPALEVSVNSTRDGVLVCHHDNDTLRSTGHDRRIAELSYAELSGLRVDARAWLGPATPLEPIPKLTDVLDRYAASHVIFIEDKQGTNTSSLLDVMDSYEGSTDHFVWKQYAPARQVGAATERGYKSWGYFGADILPRLEELAPRFDYLGIYHTADDTAIRKVVDQGKPVICWEIHTRAVRDRVTALGVQGLMCSNIPYVTSSEAAQTHDQLATGSRSAGDLPWTTEQGWDVQPRIDAASASLVLDRSQNSSYRLGSMAPVVAGVHTLAFEMCWPRELPPDPVHAGLAFGQEDDTPYRVLVPGPVGGYHLVIRPGGELILHRRDPGDAAGTRLQTITTAPVRAGEWMHFRIDVAPPSIRFSRLDGAGWSGVTMDRKYRGGYFSLCKNYPEPVPVHFRNLSVV